MFSLRWWNVGIRGLCCAAGDEAGRRFLRRFFPAGLPEWRRRLREWGIGKGDRVAILSENRPEWMIADFASLLLGAVTVPIYATLDRRTDCLHSARFGGACCFCFQRNAAEKVLSIREQTAVEKIVVMDAVRATQAHCECQCRGPHGSLRSEGQSGFILNWKPTARAIAPDDLATIIYTSGTTGTPKGVMLTHGNMASNLSCSLAEFPVSAGDVSISFLPLSHVTARHVDFALLYRGVTLAYVPLVDQVPRALQEVRAYVFCCGAAGLRKNSFPDGAEGQGVSELNVLSLGAVGGARSPARSSGGPDADHARVEAG